VLSNFLFGWLVGSNVRNARNSALPESVKQERYAQAEAKQALRAHKKAVRRTAMQTPFGRFAYLFFAVCMVVTIIVVYTK
jgi:hypothetical protein